MKNTKPNRDITAESRPRRFGKSTMVEDSFLVAAKTGQSAIYQHPDYVCLTRKSYEALTKQKEEIVKYVRDEIIGEDEQVQGVLGDGDYIMTVGANQLRAEQRQRLDELV